MPACIVGYVLLHNQKNTYCSDITICHMCYSDIIHSDIVHSDITICHMLLRHITLRHNTLRHNYLPHVTQT